MKAKKLHKLVAAHVEANGVENVDKNTISIELLQAGAGLSLVNREINKALKASGVEVNTNTGSETLKAVREHVANMSKKSLRELTTYKAVRELAENIESEHDISSEATIKVIKAELASRELPVPRKTNLQGVKSAIVEYFATTSDRSLEGLAAHLTPEPTGNEEEDKLAADKALHQARMNFTFCQFIKNGITVEEVN